jgi:hypothetical protein
MKKPYLNKQLYSECQLVVVINAHIYYGGDSIATGSYEYERLVDLVGARGGAAIKIKKAYNYLRLIQKPLPRLSLDIIKTCLDIGMPIEVCVYNRRSGNHDVLIVDYCKDILTVLNNGEDPPYMTWTSLKKQISKSPFKRHFAIVEDKKCANHWRSCK